MAAKKKRVRKSPGLQHNLGGVHLNAEEWAAVKARYAAKRKIHEKFSTWVKGTLLA